MMLTLFGIVGVAFRLFTDLSTAISWSMVAMGFSTTLVQGRDGSFLPHRVKQACGIAARRSGVAHYDGG
jgi:hypothetical protein